jgi:peptidyl-prolyl cis-trans isomerase C
MTVATVNDIEITDRDVDRTLQKLLLEFEDQIPPDQIEQVRPGLKQQAIESLVNQSLLMQEADRKGIEPDKKVVDARFEDIAGRFPRPEDFRTVLDSMGFSEQTFRAELGRNQKIESLLAEEVGAFEEATEEDVEAFYRENPEDFTVQEKVRASHILISSDPGDPDALRMEKRLEVSRLRGEIQRGGDFGLLASRHSGCPTRDQGGDLGFFERGRMEKPFEDAAFNLKPGEVSEIVETQFGFHLIKTTERQEAGILPLEEVRDKIFAFLNGRKNEKKIGEYLEKLRQTATIQYAEEIRG